ncbi:FAD-binding oxidoreductase [Parendozoicomonas haliclonae]|uniref:Anaerobic sulfite reductase subunit B n=1 Tax=Parendozoicomonas haliclonae TaxID=1960125 RepID=A0A1X7AT46_9GAMM|nr:FAD-binding oxidoreductase [Parendozoicomonas haliclonae]SMA50567.1 Anaerobic sulfite reductase subunit B [Parendozoicomonas haliclonae]
MLEMTPTAVRLIERYDDGEDIIHFTFEPVSIEAGLPDVADPKKVSPGQFFMLSVPGKGEAAFTYAATPDERGHFCALIREVGQLTESLFDCKPGDILGARGPFGKGWPEFGQRKVLVIAGGCGLAPVAAEIDALIANNANPVVYFSARSEAMLVMKNERERWHDAITLYEAVDNQDGASKTYLKGRELMTNLDTIMAEHGGFDEVICCGPEGMMEAVCHYLTDRGFPADHIWLSLERRMHCGVGLCGHCYVAHDLVCVDGPTYRWDQLGELVVKEKFVQPPRELASMGHAEEVSDGCCSSEGGGGCGCSGF